MSKAIKETKELNFTLCTCSAKEGFYCKNWNGKSDVARRSSEVREACKNNQTIDPDKCEFLVKPIPRVGVDWVWQTTCGRPMEVKKNA